MNGKGSKENAGQTVQLTRLTHSSSGGVGTRSVYVAFRKKIPFFYMLATEVQLISHKR